MAVSLNVFQYSLADVEKLDKLRPHCGHSGRTGKEWWAVPTRFKDG
jgi:hypothetical protein